MNNKDEIKQVFIDALSIYSKEHKILFSDDAKSKIAENYAMTLLLEKDIAPNDFIEENIDEILSSYAEEIILVKGE
jgi:hypothetical protein